MSYKKISEETIHQNEWWACKHDRYELPDGSEGDYHYGETRGSTMIIPVTDDGHLALVVQNRYLADKLSVEFPCGSLAEGETAVDGANRELFEATGLRSSNLIKIGEFEPMGDTFKDLTQLFVAPELKKAGEPSADRLERMEMAYRRPDEFDQMIARGEIWDGRTLAAWAIAKDFLYKTLGLNPAKEV